MANLSQLITFTGGTAAVASQINFNFGLIRTGIEENVSAIVSLQAAAAPVGTVQIYAGETAPTGWLLCDGSTLDSITQTDYEALYAVIGTIYGGTSAGSFKVPDLRGRVVLGTGTGDGLSPRTLGSTGGTETHLLTSLEAAQKAVTTGGMITVAQYLPLTDEEAGGGDENFVVGDAFANQGTFDLDHTHSIAGENAAQPHNNMQPFLTLNYIIKY